MEYPAGMLDTPRSSPNQSWTRVLGHLSISLLFAGCSSSSPPSDDSEPHDHSQPSVVPEVCTLVEHPVEPTGDLPASGLGGAGGASSTMGGASNAGSEGGNFVRQLVRLSCPSYVTHLDVARGSSGELDVVVAQRGTDSVAANGATQPDLRAHFHLLRLDEESVEHQSFPPVTDGTFLSLGLAPGNPDQDSTLVQHLGADSETPQVVVRPVSSDAPLAELPSPGRHGMRGRGLIGTSGPAIFYEASPSTPFLVKILPNTAEILQLQSPMAIAVGDTGTLQALTHDGTTLRLLSGDFLDEEQWSTTVDSGELDLALDPADENRRVMLVGERILVLEGDESTPAATLPRPSDRGCDGWGLNVGCDHCPTGTACENKLDSPRGARLFEIAGRAAVAVVSRESLESRVTDTDTSPFGVCVCDTTLIDTTFVADYLTVYEIRFRGTDQAPELLPLMRQVIGQGDGAQFFGFARDAAGELDFWYGSSLVSSGQSISDFPPDGTQYVIEHLGAD